MKKRLKRILNKKGLTLTEIIVVLFVSSVILVIATGMLFPVKELMKSIKGNAHMDTMCDTANEYIRGSLQNAASISIYKYDGSNDDDIKTQAGTYLSDTSVTTKAIAVLDNGEGYYRIYDFGEISDAASFVTGLSSPDEDYYAFLEPFYENTSYNVTIASTSATTSNTDSEGTTSTYVAAKWLQISSQCFYYYEDTDTYEATNQPRTLSFKIFGGSALITTGTADAETEYADAVVILYTVKKL